MAVTVLVIDDEPQIRRAIRNVLAADSVNVLEAPTAREGIDMAATRRPDLVVLDLALPDAEGITVCREIRSWGAVPILVLSARHSESEKVQLLDAGADDYVTKPFSSDELVARVRALLRRASRSTDGAQQTRISAPGFDLDLQARTLRIDGKTVHLTPIEWDLLRTLATHADRTLTHRQLFSAVWPGRVAGDAQQYLRVHVAHLRRKIEKDPVRPRFIHTEAGVGYRFSTGT